MPPFTRMISPWVAVVLALLEGDSGHHDVDQNAVRAEVLAD